MIRLECARAATLLQARAAGLSQASALRLEEHLSQCSECSEQAQLLDGLRALSDASAGPLLQGARQRAVLQAFATAEQPSHPSAAGSSWLVPSACGALLAVAIVGLGIVQQRDLTSGADYRVISGELEHTSLAAAGGGSQVETSIASRSGGVVALAHAAVEFRPQTRARWNGSERVLQLESGSVVADVDPAKQQTFRVDTERFRVLVLGTHFEVSGSNVRVTRGRVRVEAPNGSELAMLGPGESYACVRAPCQPRLDTQEPAAAALRARGAGKPAAGSGETTPTGEAVSVATPSASASNVVKGAERRSAGEEPGERDLAKRVSSSSLRNRPPQYPAVEARLSQARIALGRRDLARARELVTAVLAENSKPREAAEALSLRAECALLEGDLAGAAAGYLVVAQRFSNLSAGENALFASARIEADRGSGPRAQAALIRYLARYPRGRFVKEASARLRDLREVRPQL
jgi:ferric-dicitrate binding protein FerR (iron transport regulator)